MLAIEQNQRPLWGVGMKEGQLSQARWGKKGGMVLAEWRLVLEDKA